MQKIKTVFKTSDAVQNWYDNEGRDKIEKYVIDSDGIFSSDTGNKQGVYGVYVITPSNQEIPMYIGEVGKEGRSFRDRLVEHAKRWIDNSEFYTGVRKSELENGYKYRVKILAEEQDDKRRYELEQELIEQIKPYTQFNCYPKFETDYKGFDLTIFGTYRRRAFVVARDGKYTEGEQETLLDSIIKLEKHVNFNSYRTVSPDKRVMKIVEKEMPNGSTVWRNVKIIVEENMGITSARGCRYSYLVKLVAAALEPTLKRKMVS